MSPSSTMSSAAFCFSTPDAFDPPPNPPTLPIRCALIPSTAVASLPTSPRESCHSSLPLIPLQVLSPMAVAPLFLRFRYSNRNAQLRSQRVTSPEDARRISCDSSSRQAPTSRHYIIASIALPCTQSPHLVNVTLLQQR